MWGYVVSLVNEKPILVWYTAKVVVMNGNERDMCHDEIEQCAEMYQPVKAALRAGTEKTHVSMMRLE